MRSSFFGGTCVSSSLRAFAGSRTPATGARRRKRRPSSSSTPPPSGTSELWQHVRITLAWTALIWGSRLRSAAGGWRPLPLQTGCLLYTSDAADDM
eukprot:14477320-Alexandrium_andersonii.AAC.1